MSIKVLMVSDNPAPHNTRRRDTNLKGQWNFLSIEIKEREKIKIDNSKFRQSK